MKIKMFIPIALILCLAFSLCACGTTADTNETTTAPATTAVSATEAKTEATTTAPAETEAETTAPAVDEFTAEDALNMVNNSYSAGSDQYFVVRGIIDIDGSEYYSVDVMKSLDTHSTYNGKSYFVKTDGSEILEGYVMGGNAYTGEQAAADFTEEDALNMIKDSYSLGTDEFFVVRGTVYIRNVAYYSVDVMKSMETNVTYNGKSYFVKTDGSEVVEGYVMDNVAYVGAQEDAEFTEEDALNKVKDSYALDTNEYFVVRGTVEIDGSKYYSVDVMKSLEVNSTYNGKSYFVKTDGSEVLEGYVMGGNAYLN